jgi:hypothetical protein
MTRNVLASDMSTCSGVICGDSPLQCTGQVSRFDHAYKSISICSKSGGIWDQSGVIRQAICAEPLEKQVYFLQIRDISKREYPLTYKSPVDSERHSSMEKGVTTWYRRLSSPPYRFIHLICNEQENGRYDVVSGCVSRVRTRNSHEKSPIDTTAVDRHVSGQVFRATLLFALISFLNN